MISGLAELFYVNEVTNIIALRHDYGSESDSDFTSISFPMFDEYDEPYMAPAYSDGEDRLIGRDGDDLIIGNGGIGRFEPGRGDDIVFGSTDQYDVTLILMRMNGTVTALSIVQKVLDLILKNITVL